MASGTSPSITGYQISGLDDVTAPYAALANAYFEVEQPLGPVAGGYVNKRLRGDRLLEWLRAELGTATNGGSTAPQVTATFQNRSIVLGQSVTVAITASATAPATLAKVQAFEGSTEVAYSTSAFNSLTWTPASGASSRTVTVKVTDSTGAVTSYTLPQPLLVADPATQPTDLQIDLVNRTFSFQPQTGDDAADYTATLNYNVAAPAAAPTVAKTGGPASLDNGQSGTYTASATHDASRTVTKVELLDGSTVVGTDTSSPYAINFSSTAAGTHTLKFRVTDSAGATADSATFTVTVAAAVVTPTGYAPPSDAVYLYADPSYTTGATFVSGRLSTWPSKYGAGSLRKAPTSTTGPAVVPNVLPGGKPGLNYSGGGTLALATMPDTGDCYVAIVLQRATSGEQFAEPYFADRLTDDGTEPLRFDAQHYAGNWNNFNGAMYGPAQPAPGVTFLAEFIREGNVGRMYITEFGQPLTEAPTAVANGISTAGISHFTFGSFREGGAAFSGYQGVLTVWRRLPTLTERQEFYAALTA